MTTRTRLAKGIFRDKYGVAVTYQSHGKQKEKRFAADTPLSVLKGWRANHQNTSRGPDAGSFVRDVAKFLKARRSLASFKSDRSHLRPWVQRFQRRSRWDVTREQIQEAVNDWSGLGYSPKEIRHRVKILQQVYHALDGKGASPTERVKTPAVPRAQPRSVSDALVREVALNLRKSEIAGTLRDAKTRARYLVLATTGQRPAQMKRAQPDDLDLERGLWFVQAAKGGAATVLHLNEDMRAAWSLFVQAKAWGPFNSRSWVKTLQRNGWPKGIRPYNLRHTVGLSLSELGVDLGDIQAHMGHTSPTTTRIYVPGVLQRLKDASEKLDGRLSHATAAPWTTRRTTRKSRRQKATPREKTPHFAPVPEDDEQADAGAKVRKRA